MTQFYLYIVDKEVHPHYYISYVCMCIIIIVQAMAAPRYTLLYTRADEVMIFHVCTMRCVSVFLDSTRMRLFDFNKKDKK